MSEGVKHKIIALQSENYSVGDTSDRLRYHKYTVLKFIQKYFTTGSTGRVKGSGRRKITTPAENRLITKISVRRPILAKMK